MTNAEKQPGQGNIIEPEDRLPNVKNRDRLLMYVPDDLFDMLKITVTRMQLEWNKNGDNSDLEKLRHIYPIILLEGIPAAQTLDADEIGKLKNAIEKYERNVGE